MRRSLLLSALVLLATHAAAADDPPPFNKEELEALLKKEHSQRISNVYDNEKGIQCVCSHAHSCLPFVCCPRPRLMSAAFRRPLQVHVGY